MPKKLTTENLARCIVVLEYSIQLYNGASANSIEQEVFRNAVMKGFELTQEISFKLLRRVVKGYGVPALRVESMYVKDLLREAAGHTLITPEAVERWYDYRDSRNESAHDYDLGSVNEIFELLPDYLQDVRELEQKIRQALEPEDE